MGSGQRGPALLFNVSNLLYFFVFYPWNNPIKHVFSPFYTWRHWCLKPNSLGFYVPGSLSCPAASPLQMVARGRERGATEKGLMEVESLTSKGIGKNEKLLQITGIWWSERKALLVILCLIWHPSWKGLS